MHNTFSNFKENECSKMKHLLSKILFLFAVLGVRGKTDKKTFHANIFFNHHRFSLGFLSASKIYKPIVYSHCEKDEECKAIELCPYELHIAYEKRFDDLKFCGVYLVDVSVQQ